MGFKELKRRLQNWNLDTVVARIGNSTHDDLEELQRAQWKRGEGKNGEPIGFYKSIGYAIYKHNKNPYAGFGVVDGILTGSLSNKIRYSIVGHTVNYRSYDSKYEEFSKKYPNAFGLHRDSLTIYRRDTLRPKVLQDFATKVLKR